MFNTRINFFPGIMTAKLLPAFLMCFEDEYVAVRSEVCITCGNIAIKDEEVIAKLIHLATFDTIWKIKALAFQGKCEKKLTSFHFEGDNSAELDCDI